MPRAFREDSERARSVIESWRQRSERRQPPLGVLPLTLTQQEVFEAVEVAIEMAGGPATASARFALEVMNEVFSPSGGKGRGAT
jgi:hypothetical protein